MLGMSRIPPVHDNSKTSSSSATSTAGIRSSNNALSNDTVAGSKSTAALLNQLIKRQVFPHPSQAQSNVAATQAHLIAYCSRLLNSRLIPHLTNSDLLSIQDLLKKKSLKSTGNTQEALKLSKLLDAFSSSSLLRKKFSILYFFYSLAYSSGNGVGSSGGIVDMNSAGGSFVNDSLISQLQQQHTSLSLLSINDYSSEQPPGLSQPSSNFTSMLSSTSPAHNGQTATHNPALRNNSSRMGSRTDSQTLFSTPSQSMTNLSSTTPSTIKKPQSTVQPVKKVKSKEKVVTVADILNAFQQSTADLNSNETKGFYTGGNKMVGDILLLPSMHRQICRLLEELNGNSLIFQTLYSCIQSDLMKYHELLARIELHVRELTLIRLLVWTRPVLLLLDAILRLLTVMNQKPPNMDAKPNILDVLYKFSLHGDSAIRQLYSKYLNECTATFMNILTKFIMSGVINDPFNEFFCTFKDGSKGWDAIELISNKIPSFLSIDFANSVYILGKSRHFLTMLTSQTVNSSFDVSTPKKFTYENIGKLKQLITKESSHVNKMLMDTLQNKYAIFDNFNAIKNYLLMGHGDFIHEMLCSLSSELDKDATVLLRHVLVQKMETCLRSSNAQQDPEHVLGSVDVRLLEAQHGDLGWDVFSLDYRVETPLSVLFGEELMLLYLRLFNFLWRLKRSRFACGRTWSLLTRSSPLVDRGVLRSFGVFLNIIEDYVMTDVVEKYWQEFKCAVEASDFDNLTRIHAEYCKKICAGLFGNNGDVVRLLLSIFKDSVEYCGTLDKLCSLHEKMNNGQQYSVKKEPNEDGWGMTYDTDRKKAMEHAQIIQEMKPLYASLNNIQREFEEKLKKFIETLLKSDDLASLGFRLDFNNYYKTDNSSLAGSLLMNGASTTNIFS